MPGAIAILFRYFRDLWAYYVEDYSSLMTLSSLVVSRDWSEVSVLECILGSLHIGVEVEPEPERAAERLARSKVDALIVDCDVQGSAQFLKGLEKGLNSVPLVIISGARARGEVAGNHPQFVFEKPISVEQAVRTLSAARNMILDGRLRYHRQSLNLPLAVQNGSPKMLRGHVTNLSQSGAGIHMARPEPIQGHVSLQFGLPRKKSRLKIDGEVVWTDQKGNAGIRFQNLAADAKEHLQLWLAQQYLSH
jgi:hypothetical protein